MVQCCRLWVISKLRTGKPVKCELFANSYGDWLWHHRSRDIRFAKYCRLPRVLGCVNIFIYKPTCTGHQLAVCNSTMEEDAGELTVREQFRSLPATFAPASKSQVLLFQQFNIKKHKQIRNRKWQPAKCRQADASCCAWPLLAHRPEASLITGLRRSFDYRCFSRTKVTTTFSTLSNIFTYCFNTTLEFANPNP